MAGKSIKGTKSHENLKEAFAGESQANRRYLYFARVADIEGFPDMAGLFKDTADAETGHAFGHLDFLKDVGDPATGEPIGKTETNLKSAIAGETYEYTQMYPGMAKTARDEGFPELVVPGPTCSYMLKQEYPWLDGSEDANLVATHTRDLFEYLAGLHAAGQLDTRFPNPPARIAYQLPCHLKAQNMGTKSADVLRLTGATVETIEKCSAVDGTWGMKKEYFELSLKLTQPLFTAVREARADRVATDCPLAALQIRQGTGVEARHPIRILAEAYGLPDEG